MNRPKNRVYCRDCGWFTKSTILVTGINDNCNHPLNKKVNVVPPDYHHPGYEEIVYRKQASQKNKLGNCKDFQLPLSLWRRFLAYLGVHLIRRPEDPFE